ncbi:MAG: hypothetical protein KGY46_11425, partial [Anaerolineales bacterium]|nr:hypothetical protein [Anaerolineales bacterium]
IRMQNTVTGQGRFLLSLAAAFFLSTGMSFHERVCRTRAALRFVWTLSVRVNLGSLDAVLPPPEASRGGIYRRGFAPHYSSFSS